MELDLEEAPDVLGEALAGGPVGTLSEGEGGAARVKALDTLLLPDRGDLLGDRNSLVASDHGGDDEGAGAEDDDLGNTSTSAGNDAGEGVASPSALHGGHDSLLGEEENGTLAGGLDQLGAGASPEGAHSTTLVHIHESLDGGLVTKPVIMVKRERGGREW